MTGAWFCTPGVWEGPQLVGDAGGRSGDNEVDLGLLVPPNAYRAYGCALPADAEVPDAELTAIVLLIESGMKKSNRALSVASCAPGPGRNVGSCPAVKLATGPEIRAVQCSWGCRRGVDAPWPWHLCAGRQRRRRG